VQSTFVVRRPAGALRAGHTRHHGPVAWAGRPARAYLVGERHGMERKGDMGLRRSWRLSIVRVIRSLACFPAMRGGDQDRWAGESCTAKFPTSPANVHPPISWREI